MYIFFVQMKFIPVQIESKSFKANPFSFK